MKKIISLSIPCVIILGLIALKFLSSPYPHLAENEIADFPIYTQPDSITCGPTSCAMVIKYLTKKEADIEEIRKYTKTTWFRRNDVVFGMTLPHYIRRTLDKFGIAAEIKVGNLDNLKYCVDKGKPPIVLLRSGDKFWHYVVVIGYTPNAITVADPGGYKHAIDNNVFLKAWNYTGDMNGHQYTLEILNLTEVSAYTMIAPI